MELPQDLKHFDAEDYDSFRLIEKETAAWLLIGGILVAEFLFR